MKILKAYKTELDPNNKQRSYFGRCAGAARFVYNWGLAEWKRQYEAVKNRETHGFMPGELASLDATVNQESGNQISPECWQAESIRKSCTEPARVHPVCAWEFGPRGVDYRRREGVHPVCAWEFG